MNHNQVLRVFRIKATKEALLGAEADLERVTGDLRLPLLTDIKRQLGEIKDHVVNDPQQDGAAAAATKAAAASGDQQQQQAAAAAAAATALESQGRGADPLDCADEALIQKARDAIDRGMMARSTNGSTVEEIIRGEIAKSGVASPPTETGGDKHGAGGGDADRTAGSLIVHVKRVRFEALEEEEQLGLGTFGVVLAARYFGRDVAVKKARAACTSQTLEDFRCVVDLSVCAVMLLVFVVLLYLFLSSCFGGLQVEEGQEDKAGICRLLGWS